ncbi:MAG: hypothetical protein WAQ27_04000 [Candidatus Microsaccharimonas sp.]
MTTIPEVRIKYAWLLSDAASVVMNEKWGDGTPLRTYDEYVDIALKYEGWWRPYNEQILLGISNLLKLEFRQNIIDVNVAPWFTPISDPMVIGPRFETQDDLLNTLTHEMLHRLITDNTTYAYDFDFITEWEEMFGTDHSRNALIHIPIHAVMEALYRDVLKRPDLVDLDKEQLVSYDDYIEAWEYVEKVGYKKILQQLNDASAAK